MDGEARERVRARARPSRKTIPAPATLLDEGGECTPDYRDDETYSVTPDYASHESGGTLVSFECARSMEPQIDAVGQDTDVVLLTIGGNDVDFADIVMQCFVVGARDPGDCRDKVRSGQEGIGDVGVRTGGGPADPEGADAAGRAHRAGRIPVPREERRTSSCAAASCSSTCTRSGARSASSATSATRRSARRSSALNAEGGAQVIFVDEVKPHFAGHEPDGRVCCRNDDRWIHEFDSLHEDGVVPLQLDRARRARRPARTAARDRASGRATSWPAAPSTSPS